MTLHLLKTDWRRLWPWILLAWLAMLVVAIPGWSFDFESFTPWFRGLAMQWPGIEPPADPPEPAPVWLLLLHSLRHWTVLPALAVSAMLGFGGMVWDGTRPLRRVDFLRSKLLAILLFLVVPQLLVLASVLAVQGLGAGPMLAMALRTGAPLFLLHLASLLFGRLCGGLWPWLAGVAALAAIAGVVQGFRTPEFHFAYLPSLPLRLLPALALPTSWWPVGVAALAVALLLLAFRRRRPVLRIVLGCLAITVLPPLAEKVRPTIGMFPLRSIADWEGTLQTEASVRVLNPHDAYIAVKTRGLGPDEGVAWKIARGYPLSARGREIPHFEGTDRPMSRGNLVPAQDFGLFSTGVRLPVSPEIPDPEEFIWSGGAERVYLGAFDADEAAAASGELRLDAHLFGLVGRYERVLELAVGEEGEIREPGARVRARLVATPHPVMTLEMLRAPTRVGPVALDPLDRLRVLLHLPAERRTVEMGGRHNQKDWLIGELKVERRTFPMFSPSYVEYSGQPPELQVPPVPDLAGAKVMVFLPRILGKVRTRVQAEGIEVREYGQRQFEVIHGAAPGPSNDTVNCAVPMPDPDTCTLDEAGYWLNHVMRHHEHGDWAIAALGPFVARFPELFLDFPSQDQRWQRPLVDVLADWLPESGKGALLEAHAARPGDPLLSVIRARGWLDEAREPLWQAFRSAPYPDRGIVAALCHFEDPDTYPALVDSLRRAYDPDCYHAVRKLPGIAPQLDPVMREIGRELAAESPGEWDRNLRHRLVAPAAHGVREAFERVWALSGESPEHPDWPPDWYDLASVVVLPAGVGHDRERQTAFFGSHEPDDFEHDPLALAWRLKPTP